MRHVSCRSIIAALFFSLVSLLIGCGGGGGSSSTGVSPVEVEIQAVLDSFAAAIRAQNLAAAMENIDSTIRYSPENPAVPGGFEDYAQLQKRLENFFTKATVTNFTFSSSGISEGLGDIAMVRTQLSCAYNDGTGNKEITELIEMKFEKVAKWGIIEMYKYDNVVGLTGMAFPPQP